MHNFVSLQNVLCQETGDKFIQFFILIPFPLCFTCQALQKEASERVNLQNVLRQEIAEAVRKESSERQNLHEVP